jgi:hypothetical protein
MIVVSHLISQAHIQRHLDEFSWRWNRPEMGEGRE